MSNQNLPQFSPKAVVSVTEMARRCGLSRSRFYDYVRRGVFPYPLYSLATRRPFYTDDLQEEILRTKQSGLTPTGEYVLFYERRATTLSPTGSPRLARRSPAADLVEGLRALGLDKVTIPQIDAAILSVFPNGTVGVDESTVLRTVYRHLRRAGVG